MNKNQIQLKRIILDLQELSDNVRKDINDDVYNNSADYENNIENIDLAMEFLERVDTYNMA